MWFSKPIFSKAGEGYTQRSCSIVALGRSRRSFRGRIARRLRSLLSVVREKLLGNSSQEVCYHLTMVRAMLYGVTRYTQSYLYLFRRSAGGVAHGNAGLHEGAGSEGSLRKPRRAAQQRRGQHDAQDPLAGRRPSDGRRVDIRHDPQASDVGTGVTRPCVCITSALFSCQFFFFVGTSSRLYIPIRTLFWFWILSEGMCRRASMVFLPTVPCCGFGGVSQVDGVRVGAHAPLRTSLVILDLIVS